jgi:acyl carrier protein
VGEIKATAAYAPPKSQVESTIAEIWQRALGLPKVGTRDNFFDIGGHSLLVVQVLKELREKFSKPVQMTDLFRHTTIEALAKFLSSEETQAAGSSRGKARAEARRAAMGRAPR